MPTPVTSTSSTAAQENNKAEAAFVDSFASRIAAGEVGVDRGRAKADREAAAPAAPAKPADSEKGKTTATAEAGTPATDTSTKKAAPSGEPEPGSDDDAAKKTAKPDTGTDHGAAGDEVDGEPGQGTDKGKQGAGEEQVDDEIEATVTDDRDVDDLTENELALEARAQLKKHGLTVTMDDLPPEARPLVKAKFDGMTAAFTRAMMDQREYRKEETQFRAERAFVEAHPDLMIAEMIAKDPSLIDKIQARIDEAGTDTGKKAQEVVIRDERRSAVETIEKQNAAIERVNQRADAIDSYVRTACTKMNLPYDIVVDAVVNKLNDKPDDARDLTNQEIDAVIGRQQRILAKHVGERRLTQRQEEIQGRKGDKKTVSPAAKSVPDSTPAAPGGKKAPKNDAEFADYFVAKHSGAGR